MACQSRCVFAGGAFIQSYVGSMPLHAWHVTVSTCKVVQTYEDETLHANEPTFHADEPP